MVTGDRRGSDLDRGACAAMCAPSARSTAYTQLPSVKPSVVIGMVIGGLIYAPAILIAQHLDFG